MADNKTPAITSKLEAVCDAASADFPKILSMEVFAHMASTAVVNPKAFEAMKEHLPKSREMFIDILQVMEEIPIEG